MNSAAEHSRNWSFSRWQRYFDENGANLQAIPWEQDHPLSDAERHAIRSSIAIFQLGESSEGRHFRDLAQRWCAARGEYDYLPALESFIAEENRHARDLASFMEGQSIPCQKAHWTDSIFRVLRKAFNLELEVTVLICAELVARVYYRVLRDATESAPLRGICRQILHDETFHVYFQTATLARIRQGRHTRLRNLAWRGFYAATLLVVWHGHHRVFRKAGCGFRKFWADCWSELILAIRLCKTSPSVSAHAKPETRPSSNLQA
ncbi:MAG: hypothetical protein ACI8W8_001899 [Rhodothermales bacterium]|jgi:hypothetical protein